MEREAYSRLDQLEGEHWWFKARRTILNEVLNSLRAGRTGLRVLEAGCGTGGNLRMLNRVGKVSAFEPDTGALRLARSKSGCEIRMGHLPEGIPYQEGRFDIVVALDVIEHVSHDAESLSALRAQLKPGGRLVITVPALPWLWSRRDVHQHHKRRYTRTTLEHTLQQAGLKPVTLTYFNMLLFPLIAAVRAAKSMAGKAPESDDALPPEPLNRLLHIVFASERHLIGRVPMPIGVSLLAVAEAVP